MNSPAEPLRLYAVYKPKELFGIKPSFAVVLRAESPNAQGRVFFIDDNSRLLGTLTCGLQWPPESGQDYRLATSNAEMILAQLPVLRRGDGHRAA
jgi:hypothetical protein